jgi:shikimate dehydrogenase
MRLGVIGWPIAHSRSPAMHAAALAALGIAGTYEAIPVEPRDLAQFLATKSYRGLNVTIPHKESAFALCDPDELATQVGAVNTLLFDGAARPRGFNTDVHGFATWAAEEDAMAANGTAILLGSGGAARAVALALHDKMQLTIITRSPRTFTLASHTIPTAPYESLAALSARADLLVDATPRGLDATGALPDLSHLPPHATVLDLVVARETPLTRAAKARHLRASTGIAMLLHQGARAFEIWTSQPAPIEVMRAALLASL